MRPEVGNQRKTWEPWIAGQDLLDAKTDTLQALPQSVLLIYTEENSSHMCHHSLVGSSPAPWQIHDTQEKGYRYGRQMTERGMDG